MERREGRKRSRTIHTLKVLMHRRGCGGYRRRERGRAIPSRSERRRNETIVIMYEQGWSPGIITRKAELSLVDESESTLRRLRFCTKSTGAKWRGNRLKYGASCSSFGTLCIHAANPSCSSRQILTLTAYREVVKFTQ